MLSGNTHRPSKSRRLAHHLGEALREKLSVTVNFLDLVDAGRGLGAAFTRKELMPEALDVVAAVEQADSLIVTTPVYNGPYAGLFDLIDPLALVDRPVLIGATGGGQRHALVVEHQLRPPLGFYSALRVPSAVYATAILPTASFWIHGPGLAAQAVDQFATLLSARQPKSQPGQAGFRLTGIGLGQVPAASANGTKGFGKVVNIF
nr:NAD(P)H-dependent oxidoreductase [Mesorhizobium sp. LNJC403B00]